MKSRSLSFAVFFVAHSVSATAIAFLLAWIFGGLSPLIAAFSVIVSVFRARRMVRALQSPLEWRAPEVPRAWSWVEILVLSFVMFAAWKHFAWLMPLMPGANSGAITTLSATNYGDLSFHIGLIRAFASGLDFPPLNPIFALEPLRYPFGSDLYNALWEILGVPTSGHLFVTGLALTFSTLVLLRQLGGAWAMAAFFLAGGSVVASGAGAVDWKSFFLAIWITQRGMMWALPLGLMLLLYLRPHLSEATRWPRRAVSGLGRMWGLFPLFHIHSFLIVSVLLLILTWRDFGIRSTRRFLKRFFIENRALAWALPPASLLVFHMSDGFKKGSVVHWRAWWMMPEDAPLREGLAWAWKNFGQAVSSLVLITIVVISIEFVQKRKSSVKAMIDEALILTSVLILFMFFMLAPWEWDNIKVLIWPWILIFALLGRSVVRFESGLLAGPPAGSPFVILLTALGIFAAFSPGIGAIKASWQEPQQKSVTIWTLEELAHAESVLSKVSRKAVFASAMTPNHVLVYFGRSRALGYQGHLWSHAIDYSKAEGDLDTLMAGTEGWVEAAKRLKITHIYWGPDEKLRWGNQTLLGQRLWQAKLHRVETLQTVFTSNAHEIYEFKEAR